MRAKLGVSPLRLARRMITLLVCAGAASCGGGVDVGLAYWDDGWHGHKDKDKPPQTVKEPGLFLVAGDLCPTCTGSQDGRGSDARFSGPEGITVDGAGTLYVAERGSSTIRKVTSQGVVTTISGAAGLEGSTDGPGTAALWRNPTRLTVDRDGNLYVTDTGNSLVRRISRDGNVTTVAGQAGVCGSTDGTGGSALFCNPQGIVIDKTGTLFVTDSLNHTVRKIEQSGRVTTLAGRTGSCGSADGRGSGAQFCEPRDIALDGYGNLYVADTGNSTIRMVKPDGTVTTLAGQAGQCGDANGSAKVARFCSPNGVTSDYDGNLYVADTGNATVRLINLDNVVSTVAGVPGQDELVLGPLPGGLEKPIGITVYEKDSVALTSRDLVLKLVPKK